ncbi:hypothetical protein [Geobacillus sp. YF-1]|uniref:hypothetical protein n=1 Tax=Geobacillus sp. YF-1 TaxID=3457480 RepID=UPI0040457406
MQNMTYSIRFSIRETLQNQLSFLNENTADSFVTAVFHRPSRGLAKNGCQEQICGISPKKEG